MKLRVLLLAFAAALHVAADEPPVINGYRIDPELYRLMVEHGYLQTRTNFLSDVEIAQKLDLTLPQVAGVKAALDKNDAAALERELIGYLNSKLPPLKPDNPPRPAPYNDSPKVWQRPDAWLGKEITFIVNDQSKTYTVGEGVNWFITGDGEPDIKGWSWWGSCLTSAYLATGDPKYAQGVLTYARSFYKKCRPPVEFRRPIYWSGNMGPWAVGGGGRADGFMQWMYRAIAGSPPMTDADRLMFLKMFYEHGETMYRFSEEHHPHNFEFYPILILAKLAQTFPEFKESPAWRARSIQRVLENMNDCVLDDGGTGERTTYNFAYLHSYTRLYRQLKETGVPLPEEFRKKLETMYDWGIWVASPLHQYPNLNIGTFSDVSGYLEPAPELFPDRADLLYWVSNGTKGRPPERTAKVLFQTGFLTMRSDWSRDALYMAMNFNGSWPEVGTYPDLLSFGLWAHGRIYMSNAGTPVSYAHPMLKEWCTQTRASNTVEVDGQSEWFFSNSGRLESWQDEPRYTYLAAVSDNYRHIDVQHRRAVLFLKNQYWLVYDRLIPTGPKSKVHEYRWHGHFQPMELTVDSITKTVGSSVVAGKRLYLVPAQPEQLELVQGKGLISDGVHSLEEAVEGPYVSLIKKSDQPVSFAVLLAPTTNNAPAPVVTSLEVSPDSPSPLSSPSEGRGKDRQRARPKDSSPPLRPELVAEGLGGEGRVRGVPDAIAVRVQHGTSEDFIVLAATAGRRKCGPVETDGEAAFVRTERGRAIEGAVIGGKKLVYNGKSVPGITAIKPNPRALELSTPAVSTDPVAICKAALGYEYRSGSGEIGGPKQSVLVSWKTSLPSDATIEYAAQGNDTWLRTVSPEPVMDHRIVLSRLLSNTTYQIRIRCATEDGRVGKKECTYVFQGRKSE